MSEQSDTFRYIIKDEHDEERIDKALSALNDDLSRARIQGLIDEGKILLNGLVCKKSSERLMAGNIVTITIPPLKSSVPQAEDIPLNVVYEDDDLIVINKPAGLVVHPGAGNHTGTLVNALLHHCKGSLSGIGGVERPGIVHRLDKDTSGLMVAAKHDKAHKGLSAQLEDRSLSRIYKALVLGSPMPPKASVDQPIGRHPSNRQKMTVNNTHGKEAVTHYHVVERYRDVLSLVECRLESGRTHQIRVHMNYIKYPLIGDPTYGPQRNAVNSALEKAGYGAEVIEEVLNFPRQTLHAFRLGFIHPVTGEAQSFEAPLPDDISNILNLLN